jgi:hypothetical protein
MVAKPQPDQQGFAKDYTGESTDVSQTLQIDDLHPMIRSEHWDKHAKVQYQGADLGSDNVDCRLVPC